jgi:predicted nucleotidyltransferase
VEFDLKERTILLVVAGSRAYGLHTDASDVDLKGVCIPTAPYFHGYARKFEQADKSSHMDPFVHLLTPEERAAVEATKVEGSVYGIRKFCKLAGEANPNILDVLFCRHEEVRYVSRLGQRLRDARDLFVSAKAMHTFSGYANQQLKRIKTHRRWLMNPPEGKPTRAEYELPEETLIPKDQLGAAEAAVRKRMDEWEIDYGELEDAEIIHIQMQIATRMAEIETALGLDPETLDKDETKWLAAARCIGLDENFVDLMHREKKYKAALTEWQQYQHWVKTRNPERAALEKEHGFDTKHGAHLVRLLRMGSEILTTGQVHVWRGGPEGPNDREELLAIRAGAWSYEKLIEWSENLDAEMRRIYQDREYTIPKAPRRKRIDALCQELVEFTLEADR